MPLIFSPLHNLTKFISFLFFFIEDVLVILSLIYIKYVIKIIFSPGVRLSVDPHFSRASPLDLRDSLFICEKLIFEKKSWSRHLFYFYFEGKIKQERKTLKSDSIVLEKACL